MVHEVAPLPNPALQPGQALIAELMGGNVGAWLHDGFILSERLPMIRSAMARSNGHVVLMQRAASLRVEPDGSATAAVPYAEQAPQLRVARGTLRNRLAQWQRAGLLELAPGGRHCGCHLAWWRCAAAGWRTGAQPRLAAHAGAGAEEGSLRSAAVRTGAQAGAHTGTGAAATGSGHNSVCRRGRYCMKTERLRVDPQISLLGRASAGDRS